MKKIILMSLLLTHLASAGDTYFYKNSEVVLLTPVNSSLRTFGDIDYYQNEQGIVLGVKNFLIVKLHNGEDLANYLSRYNLVLQKILADNLYLLKTTDKSLTLDISNRLSESVGVEYAHPDFTKKRMRR